MYTHKGRLRKVEDKGKREYDKLLKVRVGSKEIVSTDTHPFLAVLMSEHQTQDLQTLILKP